MEPECGSELPPVKRELTRRSTGPQGDLAGRAPPAALAGVGAGDAGRARAGRHVALRRGTERAAELGPRRCPSVRPGQHAAPARRTLGPSRRLLPARWAAQ